MFRRIRAARILLSLARVLIVGASLAAAAETGARAGPAPETFGPRRAPLFRLADLQGRTIDLAECLRRGPVLLDFWATWCAPCVRSLPELERWHRTFGPRGLTVIGVSLDGPRNFARVRPFLASRGIDYAVVLDRDGQLERSYQVLQLPTSLLIDTSGTIVRTRMAYRPGEAPGMERAILALLPVPHGP